MHKRIMIVAGGDWQVPITKKAKEMGLYVISSNLYEDSPAFAYADAVKIATYWIEKQIWLVLNATSRMQSLQTKATLPFPR